MDNPFNVTGNPFADHSLAIISHLAKKDSFVDLTYDDIRAIFDSGKTIADWNSRLKSFTMIFGNNGPLYQSRGKKNEKIRREKYATILSSLSDQMYNPNKAAGICECCGNGYNCDLTLAYKNVDEKNLTEKNKNKKEQGKEKEYAIGRDYFPLIGSLGSDAQALPASSRMFSICSKCLFAINYLPVGTRLLAGKLIVFEGAHSPFIQNLIGSIVDENISRLNSTVDGVETIGRKESTIEIIDWMCDRFDEMQAQANVNLPANAEINIWTFSNSGTSVSTV